MNLRRTRAIARKEFVHILRDRRSLSMALALPLVMLLLFGYALSLDVDQIPAIVLDLDGSPDSRDLIARFEGSRYFRVVERGSRSSDIDAAIDRGKALLAVVVPPDFSRDLASGRTAEVQLLLDGSDSNTAAIARGYAEAVVNLYGADRLSGRPPIEPRLRVWYNSEMRSRNFIVPGLISMILVVIAALLTSLTIAREWENGTMEQLLSTPVRPAELVLGKLSAYFIVGLVDAAVAILVGVLIFGVPIRGSPLLVLGTTCIFLFGALCWGILVSAVARSQLLAFQLGLLTSFLPGLLLSGFIFSIGNMPLVIQAVTYIFPARYFVAFLKSAFLKGLGLEILWTEILFLAVYAALVFLAARRKLRQRVA